MNDSASDDSAPVEPTNAKRSPRTFPKVSLAVIIASTLLIAVMASVNLSTDTELQEAATGEGLEMQLRQIGVQYRLTGADPESSLSALEEEFTTPSERRQLALFWAAMADGERRTFRELRALTILDSTVGIEESPLIRRVVNAPEGLNGRDRLKIIRATGVAGELALVHNLDKSDPAKRKAWNLVVTGRKQHLP